MTVTSPVGRTSGAFQRLLDGTNVKVVCSLPGTSQYTQGAGGSSCGLACLNAIRVVYGLEGTGVQLLEQMNRPETIRACLAICASWSGEAHLEVDDIGKLPLFEASLNLRWTNYGEPRDSAFARMLRKLATEVKQDSCIALVLTRPPEMTAVFCIPVTPIAGPSDNSNEMGGFFRNHDVQNTLTRVKPHQTPTASTQHTYTLTAHKPLQNRAEKVDYELRTTCSEDAPKSAAHNYSIQRAARKRRGTSRPLHSATV